MLSKCANPECAKPFQYFRDGKLFLLRLDNADATANASGDVTPTPGPVLVTPRKPASVERFWLCGDCSRSLTLAYQRGRGVLTVPLHAARAAIAS